MPLILRNIPEGDVPNPNSEKNVLFFEGNELKSKSDAGVVTTYGSGSGLPTGGTTGQVLTKASPTNFDVTWSDSSGGFTPTLIDTGETFAVPANKQAFWRMPITVTGTLVVTGYLIEI